MSIGKEAEEIIKGLKSEYKAKGWYQNSPKKKSKDKKIKKLKKKNKKLKAEIRVLKKLLEKYIDLDYEYVTYKY